MYVLFLESKAARQVREFVATHPDGWEAGVDDLLAKAYANSATYHNGPYIGKVRHGLGHEEWWVDACLRGDFHKHLDVNKLFYWAETPEGNGLWMGVYRMKGVE